MRRRSSDPFEWDPWDPDGPVPRKRRKRRPSLTRELSAARKADANVVGATIAADGSVSLTFGEPAKTPSNELDEWIAKHAH
jgi:hypothetical protein